MAVLAGLPHDILWDIFLQLEPRDVLAVIQTCRGLHAIATADYVWRHIHTPLPLDITRSRAPSAEIRRAVVNALRLDRNWRRSDARIRTSKLTVPALTIAMQPLGRDFLLTLTNTELSLWHVPHGLCLATFDAPRAFGLAAALDSSTGSDAIACVLGTNSCATVYRIGLRVGKNEHFLVNEWKLESQGTFYQAQVCGPIVAAAAAILGPTSYTHQIHLFNTQTGTKLVLEPPDMNDLAADRTRFTIFSKYMIIAGGQGELIRILIRELPEALFAEGQSSTTSTWGSSISDFYSTGGGPHVDLFISQEPLYEESMKNFTILAYHRPVLGSNQMSVYQVPLHTIQKTATSQKLEPECTFLLRRNPSLEIVCLGKGGRRVVWLEQQWDMGEYRLMKATIPTTLGQCLLTQSLQPLAMAFPFQDHTCKLLWFEESAGRVWVGVHTGEVYILDFQP